MLHQITSGAAAVVPIVTDQALYAPASTTMLHMLRRFVMPALKQLNDPTHVDALTTVKHYMLEMQFILAQIEDVERHRQNKSGT